MTRAISTRIEDVVCMHQVIGRSKEVARVVQVLARRSKNNPILLGEPGVGKTAIAEGLARAIVTGLPSPSTAERKLCNMMGYR